jgi:hypothetical protein
MALTRERNRMTTLFCSHCRSDFPRGANVCTGCQAEAHYGVPRRIYYRVAIAAVAAGMLIGSNSQSWVVGLAVTGVVLIGGIVWARRRYKSHVQFLRRPRTKNAT